MPDYRDFQLLSRVHEQSLRELRIKRFGEAVYVGKRAFELKNRPEWDWFIQELNKVKEDADNVAQNAIDTLIKESTVDPNEIVKLKNIILISKQRAQDAEEFYGLVDKMITNGEAAQIELGKEKIP